MLRSQSLTASAFVARNNVTSSFDRCFRIIMAFLHSTRHYSGLSVSLEGMQICPNPATIERTYVCINHLRYAHANTKYI